MKLPLLVSLIVICLLVACKKENDEEKTLDISQKLLSNSWSYHSFIAHNNGIPFEIREAYTVPNNITYTFYSDKTLKIHKAAGIVPDLLALPPGTGYPMWDFFKDNNEATYMIKWEFLPAEKILKLKYSSDMKFTSLDHHEVTPNGFSNFYRLKSITDSTIFFKKILSDNSEEKGILYGLKKK